MFCLDSIFFNDFHENFWSFQLYLRLAKSYVKANQGQKAKGPLKIAQSFLIKDELSGDEKRLLEEILDLEKVILSEEDAVTPSNNDTLLIDKVLYMFD